MADCSLHRGGKVKLELTVHEMGKCIAKMYAARATQNIQGYDDDVGRLSPCMLLSTSCCCLLRGLGGFLSPVKYTQEAYLESKQAVIIVLALHTYRRPLGRSHLGKAYNNHNN